MMKSWIIGLLSAGFLLSPVWMLSAGESSGVYGFTMTDIDGKPLSLAEFKGKVLLIVNVASKCGLTPQYKPLQEVYAKYRDKGFVVLGFPANNFKEQEPGGNGEIKTFCSVQYGVEFPMFAKISVKGDDIHPLYKYLTESVNPALAGEIRWNFDKFLIGRDGAVLNRFHPKTPPGAEEVVKSIEAALAEK